MLILEDLSVYDTVEELADKIGTSAYKLRNAFKKQYAVSLPVFSRTHRIEEAKRLLNETNYTLQTIAGMVGFEEGNNFLASFKTVVGCTPGEWRKRINKFEA